MNTETKGAILDTNASVQDATDYMLANNRVAAFGKVRGCLNSLNIGDTVFLYRKGEGIVAAAKVTTTMQYEGEHTSFCEVDFLLRPEQANALSAAKVKEVLGHGFFWAKTLKAPYLTLAECRILLDNLNG